VKKSAGDDGDHDLPLAWSVALHKKDSLPGAELKLTTLDWDSDRGPNDRTDHMVGRVRRIVSMTELDFGNDSLEHFHQVFVGALDGFSGGDSGGRVPYKHIANSGSRQIRNVLLDFIGYIDNLFVASG